MTKTAQAHNNAAPDLRNAYTAPTVTQLCLQATEANNGFANDGLIASTSQPD